MKQKQYAAAKKEWEERTGEKAIAVRLSKNYLIKLEGLAARYGGNRRAIEAGIDALLKDDAD